AATVQGQPGKDIDAAALPGAHGRAWRSRLRARASRIKSAGPAARGSDRKRGSASAGGFRIRIADHELGPGERFVVVDLGTGQVLQAEWIDQQEHAIALDGEVIFGAFLVEGETVLESRTAAAADVDAQLEFRIAFLGDQFH